LDETFDHFRPPYGMVAEDFQRQCVFAGTTNEEEYLKDNTGGRRFWPVRCYKIDLDSIIRDRDQLFAEAVQRYKADETWWEMPASAKDEQDSRRMSDEWENVMREFLQFKDEVTVTQIFIDCLKIDIGRMDNLAQRRIGKILHNMKWKKHNLKRDGKQIKIWLSPSRYGAESPEF
jgi:predicted P-loop ATPase